MRHKKITGPDLFGATEDDIRDGWRFERFNGHKVVSDTLVECWHNEDTGASSVLIMPSESVWKSRQGPSIRFPAPGPCEAFNAAKHFVEAFRAL